MGRLTLALGFGLACLSCVCAQHQTEIGAWLMPRSCAVFRLPLLQGGVRFQLVPSPSKTLYRFSGIASGCVHTEADGTCQRVADASRAACSTAITTASAAKALQGQLDGLQAGAEGYVYAYNPHFYPVMVDMLVIVAPKTPAGSRARRSLQGRSAVSRSAKAMGLNPERRRLTWHRHGNDDGDHGGFGGFSDYLNGHGRGSNCTNGTDSGCGTPQNDDPDSGHRFNCTRGANSTSGGNSTAAATADVLNPDTGNTTATASTASNLIDQAANNYSGATRSWVKVAIIVAIVVVSLALLAMLACLVSCLCRRRRAAAAFPAGKQFVEA